MPATFVVAVPVAIAKTVADVDLCDRSQSM
jgi:hypothetical protein